MTARATGRGPRALSRFFAEHQACGGGFDVGRPEGGLVRVTCSGCGGRFVYETAAGSLPEGSAMPASALDPTRDDVQKPTNGAPAGGSGFGPAWWSGRGSGVAAESAGGPEPAPGSAAGPKAPTRGRAPRRRRRLVNGWVDGLIIAAMLCAAAIVVLSVAGVGEESSDDRSESASAPERSSPGDQASDSGRASPDDSRAGAGAEDREGSMERPPGAGDDVDPGRARTFFSAYEISVPDNWRTMRRGSFVELICEDRNAGVRVYHEQRSGKPEQMEDELRRFIKDEHPGADIGRLQRTRVGGADAASLTARFGGSVETATVVSKRPYLYLIVSRWDKSASEDERAEATAVVNSFRPA